MAAEVARERLVALREGLLANVRLVDVLLAEPEPVPPPALTHRPMAWGAKVSPVFRDRVRWIVDELDIGDDLADGCDKLMTCMAWESGRSFRPDVKNLAGSGATGLIQFMPATAKGMGTTVEKMAALSAEDQLRWVYRYFEPFKGRLRTLADLYMAILWPKGVGKPDEYPLFTGGVAYRQNAGLDVNKDGIVTKAEAARKVLALLEEGLRPGNVA